MHDGFLNYFRLSSPCHSQRYFSFGDKAGHHIRFTFYVLVVDTHDIFLSHRHDATDFLLQCLRRALKFIGLSKLERFGQYAGQPLIETRFETVLDAFHITVINTLFLKTLHTLLYGRQHLIQILIPLGATDNRKLAGDLHAAIERPY